MTRPKVRDIEIPLAGLTGMAARHLPGTTMATLTGPEDAPLVIVLGGISASAGFAYSSDGKPGWWQGVFHKGGPVDTGRYRLLGLDFIADEDGRFAPTTKDQCTIIAGALRALGEEEPFAVIGASYGGMVALAYAQNYRPRSVKLVIISAGQAPHPMSTAARSLQRQVVALGLETGRGGDGLALARAMAMTTYRTRREFAQRFAGGIESTAPLSPSEPGKYLSARGQAYLETMSPGRFLSLSASIDRHRVAPGRIKAPALVIGIEEDQVVPLEQAAQLAGQLGGKTRFRVVRSIYGHDAFLKEPEIIGGHIASFLENGS